MSYHTSLPSFMMLSWFWFSVRILVSHPPRCELTVVEVRCCGLSRVWFGGDGYVRQEMWLVLLESAMDRFLRVDNLEQPVPPCVWYGMACLLIRDAIGTESCSIAWGKAQEVT
jgi:hypothetical protein